MAAQSLTFQSTTFDVIDRNGKPWLKAADLARALGYAREDSVSRIYDRNADEFTSAMSGTVNLTGPGNLGEITVRIFSLRGAHLLAMFARTAAAKTFRKWVLDVLELFTEVDANVGDQTIGTDGFNCLASLVDGKVRHLPTAAKRSAKMHIWGQVHAAFSVTRAEFIPAEKMDSVRNFIASQAVDGEWMPADKAPRLDEQHMKILGELCRHAKYVRAWFGEVQPGLRVINPRLAYMVHDHMMHMSCAANGIAAYLNLDTPQPEQLSSVRWIE